MLHDFDGFLCSGNVSSAPGVIVIIVDLLCN